MQIKVKQAELVAALAMVDDAVSKRVTLPILRYVLVEAEGDSITLSTTDLDTFATVRITAVVEESGSVCVPVGDFLALAERLSGTIDIGLDVTPKSIALIIECKDFVARLEGYQAAEFPTCPIVVSPEHELAFATLEAIVRPVAACVSDSEGRPILNGVGWTIDAAGHTAVATDGHRLALKRLAFESDIPALVSMIVAPKALYFALEMFADTETVKIARSEGRLRISGGAATLTTRLIGGPYPNYENVIPTAHTTVAQVDRRALHDALARIGTMASDQTHRVTLRFEKLRLFIQVDSPGRGQARDTVKIKLTGEPLRIEFNARYLLDVLGRLACKMVEVRLVGDEKAVVIVDPTDETYLQLVMPLRLLSGGGDEVIAGSTRKRAMART